MKGFAALKQFQEEIKEYKHLTIREQLEASKSIAYKTRMYMRINNYNEQKYSTYILKTTNGDVSITKCGNGDLTLNPCQLKSLKYHIMDYGADAMNSSPNDYHLKDIDICTYPMEVYDEKEKKWYVFDKESYPEIFLKNGGLK